MALKLADLCEKITLNLSADKELLNKLRFALSDIIHYNINQDLRMADENYCFKFAIKETAVLKLFTILNLSQDEVFNTFESEWPTGTMKNRMYANPYYHILFVILLYALKTNDRKLAEQSLLVGLFRIWNGRKAELIPYCDKKIMKYVVSYMCTNRHEFSKHSSPLGLLRDYHVPKLLETYSVEILRDPSAKLYRLLAQMWSRIRQHFVQNMKTNIKTGKSEAQGGILPMYMKAKAEGLSISNPNISSKDEEQPGFDDYTTVSNYDEIASTVSDFITMNSNISYPPNFINKVNTKTTVGTKLIEIILKNMHNYQYHDIIHELIVIILNKTGVVDRTDVCSPTYYDEVDKNIIRSKNNTDSKKINTLSNDLLQMIFEKVLQKNLSDFSNTTHGNLRTIIMYGLVFNIQREVCR